ncbi:MAG: sensor histidine kinase [Deltaproteobacteria bacterium]|nr:sensor histidine kinase [Deltaproteobacteria bacterium]
MTTSTAVVRIGAREAQRLKERFLTRATAVFYARCAFLVLGLGILLLPSWQRAFAIKGAWPWFGLVVGVASALACQGLAAHPVHGRRVMFMTLLIDLTVLLVLVARSGGLESPAMPAQLLFTIFFALLFPNPVAILPPLMVLPAAILVGQLDLLPEGTSDAVQGRATLASQVLHLAWLAALNGVAVYVMVYLTSREEKQNREILELEQSLGKMALVEERNRLARDIHDGLGASLSGVIIQAEYLMTLTRKDADLHGEVKELKTGAEEAIDEVRRAVSMWREDFLLVPQLENMCTTYTTRHKLPIELTVDGEPFDCAEEQELTVFRILQECLTNIAKHAAPTRVIVKVRFARDKVSLDIIDDGKGFDVTKTPKNHYGLINMKERARKANGEVAIESQLGKGTTVVLAVKPLPRKKA